MKIAIVSNLSGKGLQVDAELLQEFLVSDGHEVTLVQFDQPWEKERFELGIMLEVVQPHMFVHCDRWWWFPNLEWTKPQYLSAAKEFQYIFAKTHNAKETLSERFTNVHHVGFLTRDKLDESIPRERKFLHLGGGSGFKNTAAVISAWREYRYFNGIDAQNAHLTVVSNSTEVCCEETDGITFIKRASDDEIKQLQNSHLFHLLPSATEGWGHSLHEGQSVGAVILTTDARPMNYTLAPFLVPSFRQKKANLATLHEVSPEDIRELIPEMLSLTDKAVKDLSHSARLQFEENNRAFKQVFTPFFFCSPAPIRRTSHLPKARIAILGNFRPEHSTENDLKWTLEDMGYAVEAFQEDEVPTESILGTCRQYRAKLLIYVHTHGWQTPGKISLDNLWQELKSEGIATCSFHLDKYWGLNELDQRENLIGVHPFWHTNLVFTADGSDHPWEKRGVRHSWLPAAIAKRHCFLGVPHDDLSVEVGFVGARGYHPEYLFRGELIEFLEKTYGKRFRVFNGFRGQRLNDLYASVDILIGDCCFAGTPRYISDRWPETCGRGGFLLVPQIDGVCIPTATFRPGDLGDLKNKVDYYLEHGDERDLIRRACFEHVKGHDTYTNRMRDLLAEVGL